TSRLVKGLDTKKTYINALTSLTPNCAKIPIYFDTDREAISMALGSLAMDDTRVAKIVRIADTLTLDHLQISESAVQAPGAKLEMTAALAELQFDSDDNLLPLAKS
ncbi:MAG TPA: [Fe-S]-binding protein, partial [Candidatus Binatia bacterium]|nr:[Fe-S]-binding protein [Candidatus Binatia bacterium]